MFVRKVKTKGKTYLSLVHSIRQGKRIKQVHIANLGNLQKHRERLLDIGTKILLECGARNIPAGDVIVLKANEYGRVLLLQKLFEESGLEDYLLKEIRIRHKPYISLAHIKAMIFNRVCDPCAKYSLLRWLEDVAFEGIELPEVITPAAQKKFAEVFYRNMDFLLPLREEIELFLYNQVKTLFDIKVDVIFYDLTSTYFEGAGPEGLASYGYSRDEKPNNPQIVIGVVVVGGFPIAHEIFKGNVADKETVQGVVDRLRKRFKIRRVVFVGDSGILSEENIEYLEKSGYEYVIACRRRRTHRWWEIFSGWEESSKEMRCGILWSEKQLKGGRVILCHNEERRRYEQSIREGVIKRIQSRLEKLARMIKEGRLTQRDKIIARVERILQRKRGRRYFSYSFEEGKFSWSMNEKQLRVEKFLEGKFFLLTNNKKMKAEEVITVYKDLVNIERTFRQIKDFIRVRPIYHWTGRRVRAHIFICMLGHFLEKMLERKLEMMKVKMTARRALESVRTVKLAQMKIGEEIIKQMTKPGPQQQGILKAILGVQNPPL